MKTAAAAAVQLPLFLLVSRKRKECTYQIRSVAAVAAAVSVIADPEEWKSFFGSGSCVRTVWSVSVCVWWCVRAAVVWIRSAVVDQIEYTQYKMRLLLLL